MSTTASPGRSLKLQQRTTARAARKADLEKRIYYATYSNIPRDLIYPVPHAIQASFTSAQRASFVDDAFQGQPKKPVYARYIPNREDGAVEVFIGWEYLEGYWEARPKAKVVPIKLVEASDEDVAYYAIEHSYRVHIDTPATKVSSVDYGLAAKDAREKFDCSLQHLADALCITHSVLSNHMSLAKRLEPQVLDLLRSGELLPAYARILTGERRPHKQISLAKQAVNRKFTTQELYQEVHPDYVSKQTINSPGKPTERSDGDGDVRSMETRLEGLYGAPARIAFNASENYAGTVELTFHNYDELQGIYERLNAITKNSAALKGVIRFDAADMRQADALLQDIGATEPDSEYALG